LLCCRDEDDVFLSSSVTELIGVHKHLAYELNRHWFALFDVNGSPQQKDFCKSMIGYVVVQFVRERNQITYILDRKSVDGFTVLIFILWSLTSNI
jgi:hypothetical protein